MPLKLVPPKAGRNKVYRVRGTYLGSYVDRSAETTERAKAQRLLKAWEAKIERGELSRKQDLTFAGAVASYLAAGGDKRFMRQIVQYFGDRIAARDIDQATIDAAAIAIYGADSSPATRNRQVYTPISAALRHAGVQLDIRRPKGAHGVPRHVWLRPEQFEAVAASAALADLEFGALVILLRYTGLRLSEGLRLRCEDVDLTEQSILCRTTKNGEPRLVYLPDRVIVALANHPRGIDRPNRLFRWSKSGEIYLLAERAYAAAAVDHGGAPFHVLRHTYGASMQRVGADLVATRAWKSATAARIYKHFDVTDEARKASLLPGANRK